MNLGTFPSSERYFYEPSDLPRPLGKITSIGLTSTAIFIGTGDSFFVSGFALDGRRSVDVRATREAVPVTQAQIDVYVNQQLSRQARPATRGDWERYLRQMQYPKTYPSFGQLLVDDQDNLWIEDFPIPGASHRDWSIYSATGAIVARLRVPGNLRLLDVGRTYVLGAWWDEDDAQSLRLYSLTR